MGATGGGVTGPDFGVGIAVEKLPEGKPVLGQAHGEAVVLVRSGAKVQAIGASCTHYGGPLAEGLVVDGELRCPWHHACFSLETGEPLRAPALNPVPCYAVEVKGGIARVGGKRTPSPKAAVKGPASVVIVGAGAAGNAAAEQLRREGYAGPITMLGRDRHPPYDRPNLSKDYLAGNAPEDWIPLRSKDFYAGEKIALREATTVSELDPGRQQVVLHGGEVIPYDALVLCTGAEPVRLPTPGANLPHVRTLRSLDDSRELIAAAKSARRVVLIGAGFIGLEVAASLRTRGLAVHVVAPETVPLERVVGKEVGALVRSVHEAHGVTFSLGHTVAEISSSEVRLDDGTRIPADLVVVGVGVRPELGLAERAGLALDRGVRVDAELRTSDPRIWAAGDIARFPDRNSGLAIRVEHWVVAERMGQTAARNILGAKERFEAAPFFWTTQHDLTLNYVGHAEKWDRVEIEGDLGHRDAKVSYFLAGKLLAVVTIGRDLDSLKSEVAIEHQGSARAS